MKETCTAELAPWVDRPVPMGELPPRQRAVLETVMAYYYSGHYLQYDSAELTLVSRWRNGNLRRTDDRTPEDATRDDYSYMVCSSFCYEVYYQALGYKLLDPQEDCTTMTMMALPENDPICVFKHHHQDSGDMESLRRALAEMKKRLQPGDLIVNCAGIEKGGHVMIYLGDVLGDGIDRVAHCSGRKYNMRTGEDAIEGGRYDSQNGAILCSSLEDMMREDRAQITDWSLAIPKRTQLAILRPLNDMDPEKYPLSPATVTRLQYPRLVINRWATLDRLRSAEPGEDITVTVKLTNMSCANYTSPLDITERIPGFCVLKPGSITGGGSVDGNTILWKRLLRKGESCSLQYTVTVSADPDDRGRTVMLGGGSVGGIRSNRIPVTIGGRRLSREHMLKLYDLEDGCPIGEPGLEGGAFARALYRSVINCRPRIPDLSELESRLYHFERIPGLPRHPLLVPNDAAPEDFTIEASMQIPSWFGGREVWSPKEQVRLFQVLPHQLYVGDVFLAEGAPTDLGIPSCMVYLGNDRVACPGQNGMVSIRDASVLKKILTCRLFAGLRPTLAYNDLSRETGAETAAAL